MKGKPQDFFWMGSPILRRVGRKLTAESRRLVLQDTLMYFTLRMVYGQLGSAFRDL